jgi:aspartate/glutamate racemase
MVGNASPSRVVKEQADGLLEDFLSAAFELSAGGVKAITTSCGFMALHQKTIAAKLPVPVFTSSLMQIPMVQAMLQPGQKVGVLTADSRHLTADHFSEIGVVKSHVVVRGLETGKELHQVLLNDKEELNVEQAEADMVEIARELVSSHTEVGAIVLECTNMPPYAEKIKSVTGLPVFDIVTLTNFIYKAVASSG